LKLSGAPFAGRAGRVFGAAGFDAADFGAADFAAPDFATADFARDFAEGLALDVAFGFGFDFFFGIRTAEVSA
jgi:hypothetical protein